MTTPTTPGALARAQTPIAASVRRIAATGALALSLFGISAPAASAGADESIETRRGAVTFNHYGERITAADNLADGFGVRAYLHWSEYGVEQSASVTDDRGAGGGFVVDKNLNIREGVTVLLTMCSTDNGVDVMCSYAQRGEA